MISLYRQVFISKHGEKDDGTWFETLKDLTPHALAGGIERIMTLKAGLKFAEFPPNAMQFKALCLAFYDEDIKLPSITRTFDEICDFVNSGSMHFSHPIVKYIASKMDENFYQHARDRRYHACKDSLQQVYDAACYVLRQGFELPEVILHPRCIRTSTPAVARKHLNSFKLHLSGKSS